MVKSEDGKTEGGTPPSRGRLRSVGGSLNDKFNVFLVSQALNTLWLESDDPHLRDEFVSISLALMAELAPRDALAGITNNCNPQCSDEMPQGGNDPIPIHREDEGLRKHGGQGGTLAHRFNRYATTGPG
jgi:hypothetical protein